MPVPPAQGSRDETAPAHRTRPSNLPPRARLSRAPRGHWKWSGRERRSGGRRKVPPRSWQGDSCLSLAAQPAAWSGLANPARHRSARRRPRWALPPGNCRGSGYRYAARQMPVDGDERCLPRENTPCRNGPAPTPWKSDRAHVPYPFHEIKGYGRKREDRNQTHQNKIVWRWLEVESEGGQHQCREGHLRHRIELRYHRRLHRNRLVE